MSKKSKQEYIAAIRARYLSSNKEEKQKLLYEICTTCGYNRKYAIRILNKKEIKGKPKKKAGRKKKFAHNEIIAALKNIWKSTNLICSKRLKYAIPLWLPFYEGELTEENRKLLLRISPATIDRLLKPIRNKFKKKGLSTTKPGSLIKKQVPIKTNQWDESSPGFIEADTVAHCGDSITGSFVYTVNTVDIATGWTEARAVWGKGQQGTFKAIESIENSLPFKVIGFDSDNGGEFLNWHLLAYFTKRKQPVDYTRSRAYMKNDNAHIEGKNWTHIRQYFGYHRFDNIKIVELMNDIFTNEWSLFFNFFIPSSKIISKVRDGSQVIKKHDQPKTPFQRILDSTVVSKKTKILLTNKHTKLNPFLLQNSISRKINEILKLI